MRPVTYEASRILTKTASPCTVVVAFDKSEDMEYRVLALSFFLCCAVLSSAQSNEGSGLDVIPTDDEDIITELECDGAKVVYDLASPSRGVNSIFDEMRDSEFHCSKTLVFASLILLVKKC